MMQRCSTIVRNPRGCTVYALVDPRSPEDWRYIGQAYDARMRLRGNIAEAMTRQKVLTPKLMWIRSLLNEGVAPQLAILESEVVPNLVVERETYWINQAARGGHKITNAGREIA